MKIGLFNIHNSYLFYDLTEGFKANGHEVVPAFFQVCMQPQVDIGLAIKELLEVRDKLASCDYVFHVNYAPIYNEARLFDPEKTGVVFFDPPTHFPAPSNIALNLQMTKVGPHRRIEWGVMQRFWEKYTEDITYACGAFMRLYLDQADAIFRSPGGAAAAINFYKTAMERVQGVYQATKIMEFSPLTVFGGKDWGKFGINCKMNKHEDLHLWMAKCANILDHCREDIGENPKFLYACAMEKPFYNIERNPETNEIIIVRKPWRKPRHIKEFCAEWVQMMTDECGRRKTQFVGSTDKIDPTCVLKAVAADLVMDTTKIILE